MDHELQINVAAIDYQSSSLWLALKQHNTEHKNTHRQVALLRLNSAFNHDNLAVFLWTTCITLAGVCLFAGAVSACENTS